jgi:predicted patatin/cPLA2 family phospholipase
LITSDPPIRSSSPPERISWVMPELATALWSDDHPVLEVLRERRRTASTPAQRAASGDPVKVGLAVEGGGMRAVTSAGMLTALEDLGLSQAFDAVYGASAGALNGAFFLLGETWYPLSIYYDDLASKTFVDFTRPLRGESILNLDYAFEEILEHRKPLDYERVLASDIPLHVAITSVSDQATVVVSKFEGRDDLKAALRASSWLPGAVRGTTEFRGERALDGSVLTAHPWPLAATDGCTHILSLSTHPILAPRRYNTNALRAAVRYLDRIEPGLGYGYLRSLRNNDEHLRRLRRSMTDPTPDPYVLDLGPLPGAPHIRRHETDRSTIMDAARHGYEVMYAAVEKLPPPDGEVAWRAIPRFTFRAGRPETAAV